MGGGFELCLGCHYRVAVNLPSVVLGLPEVQVGLLPAAGGTQRLLRILGILGAMPYLLEGKHASAVKAKEIGLIHELVAPADLLSAAKKWLMETPNAVQPWDVKGFQAVAPWIRVLPPVLWWATPCCKPTHITTCQPHWPFKVVCTKVHNCPSTRRFELKASTWPH
jgi:enoyl-CoA hydratase/carnithine racemase